MNLAQNNVMPKVTKFNGSFNAIADLTGLATQFPNLEELWIHSNRIAFDPRTLLTLRSLTKLRRLRIRPNPFCKIIPYQKLLIGSCGPQLEQIDQLLGISDELRAASQMFIMSTEGRALLDMITNTSQKNETWSSAKVPTHVGKKMNPHETITPQEQRKLQFRKYKSKNIKRQEVLSRSMDTSVRSDDTTQMDDVIEKSPGHLELRDFPVQTLPEEEEEYVEAEPVQEKKPFDDYPIQTFVPTETQATSSILSAVNGLPTFSSPVSNNNQSKKSNPTNAQSRKSKATKVSRDPTPDQLPFTRSYQKTRKPGVNIRRDGTAECKWSNGKLAIVLDRDASNDGHRMYASSKEGQVLLNFNGNGVGCINALPQALRSKNKVASSPILTTFSSGGGEYADATTGRIVCQWNADGVITSPDDPDLAKTMMEPQLRVLIPDQLMVCFWLTSTGQVELELYFQDQEIRYKIKSGPNASCDAQAIEQECLERFQVFRAHKNSRKTKRYGPRLPHDSLIQQLQAISDGLP